CVPSGRIFGLARSRAGIYHAVFPRRNRETLLVKVYSVLSINQVRLNAAGAEVRAESGSLAGERPSGEGCEVKRERINKDGQDRQDEKFIFLSCSSCLPLLIL